MSISKEKKLKAVLHCKSGKAARTVGKSMHIDHHYILEWVCLYDTYGISGLEKQPYKIHSFQEKVEILKECEQKLLPLHVICAQHRISRTVIQKWLRIARNQGIDVLADEKLRGRRPKESHMARPKKKVPDKELEILRYENERLKVEVLLLKKVKALVEERNAQNRRIGRGPSKN
jgi:transposase